MRDPLAPEGNDPYTSLNLSADATPDEAEQAMDAYNRRSPGRETQAAQAWDMLRDPARRLAVDAFRYSTLEETSGVPPVAADDFDRIVESLSEAIQASAAGLDFGPVRDVQAVEALNQLSD